MRYKYPRINNWLSFSLLNGEEYEVRDYLNEKTYVLDRRLARFAMRLNGKRNPYLISRYLTKREVASYLDALDKHNLLRRSSILSASVLELYNTIWIPKHQGKNFQATGTLNLLLLCCFAPILLIGILVFMSSEPKLSGSHTVLSLLTGYIGGAVLHELAHANACLAYGGRVFEIGALFRLPFVGAYVLMDESSIKCRMKRVQVNAAGIEMNLLLAGVLLLVASLTKRNSGFYFNMALANAITALLNLLLIQGLDGEHIMSDLLGIGGLGKASVKYALTRSHHLANKQHGLHEASFSMICTSVFAVQALQIVFLLIDGWVIISWLT